MSADKTEWPHRVCYLRNFETTWLRRVDVRRRMPMVTNNLASNGDERDT